MATVPTDKDLTLMAFMQRFSTPASCLKHLEAIRWREGESCLKCAFVGQMDRLRDGKSFKCPACKKLFMVITDTMFGGSPIKLLPKWFVAIWIETNHRKGVSSVQLAKLIGTPQKTFMLQRIRQAAGKAKDKADDNLLAGIVEIDETSIGGKEKNKHPCKRTKGTQGQRTKTKCVAIGLAQRDGQCRAFASPTATAQDREALVSAHVRPGAEIYADAYHAYASLASDYPLHRVTYSRGEYVRKGVPINTVESLWASLKRLSYGIHHHRAFKHMQRSLNSVSGRINRRSKADHPMTTWDRINDLLGQGLTARTTDKQLVKGEV